MTNLNSRISITLNNKKTSMQFSELLDHAHQFVPRVVRSLDNCIAFYSEPDKKYSGPWNPFWIRPDEDQDDFFLEHLDDRFLEDVSLTVTDAKKKRRELFVQITQFLADYWGYPEIKTDKDSFKIGNKRSRIKKGDPLPWVEEDEFKPLLNQLIDLRAEMALLSDQVEAHLVKTYNYSYVKEFGEQKAKDLIDRSYNARPKTALKYLTKAISYGRPTFMSYKAFRSMGNTYRYLEQHPSAIEAYTNAIEDFEAASVNMSTNLIMRYLYLARGLCLWEIDEKEAAVKDLRIATRGISNPNQFGPHDAMYLDAKEKLARFDEK